MSQRTRRAAKNSQPVDEEIVVHADVHESPPDTPVDNGAATTGRQETPPDTGTQPNKKAPSKNKAKGTVKPSAQPKRHTVLSLASTVGNMNSNMRENSDRIGSLEGEMKDMHSKIDWLVNNSINNSNNGNRQAGGSNVDIGVSPPSRGYTSTRMTHDSPLDTSISVLPTPSVLRREENRHGHIDRMLEREDFVQANSNSGKPTHDTPMCKPYMFLERDGYETVKQRAEIRTSMTQLEYLNASLLLLNDKTAYRHVDLPHIIHHLSQVSTDAIALPWHGVRKWSQYIWDQIERGKCSWRDKALIQEERVRLSFIGQSNAFQPHTSGSHIHHQKANELVVVVCSAFNSPAGCKFQYSHDDGRIKHNHVCAHCEALGRRSNHSFQRCRTRMDGNQQSSHSQSYPSDGRQWAGHYNRSDRQNYHSNGAQQPGYNRGYNQQNAKN